MSGIKRYFKPIDPPSSSNKRHCTEAAQSHLDNCNNTPTKDTNNKIRLLQACSPTTPTTQLASSLRSTFVSTPAPKETPTKDNDTRERSKVESLKSAASDEVQHVHNTYKFLYPPHRRDINKNKPDQPDYDEKTLFVPESFLNSQTPALRQWWEIKRENMDAILFFKMGKFYELFNEDAVIAVNNLDIIYMKGDETKPAHAGFPEISYEKYSKILVEKGFKVMRIEQTETPAMMEERCRVTGQKSKFDRVVQREVCRTTTRGTQMLGVMESVFHSSQNQYLMAIREMSEEAALDLRSKLRQFGVCFVDVTIGRIFIGQFKDDHNLSRLNILLAHNNPIEILYEKGNINPQTYQSLLKTGALLTPLKPKKESWSIKQALTYLKTNNIFQNEKGKFEWPPFLYKMFIQEDLAEDLLQLEPDNLHDQALDSFAAIVYYLQEQLIADQVLSCASFEFYVTPLDGRERNNHVFAPMILDHVALRNLEVFQNSSGGSESTLFSSINHCKTHFGQRLLKNWLCSPLCDIKQIQSRLDAVQALISNENASLMNEIVHILGSTPDMERLLSKIKSQCFKSESDSRAVMFDANLYSKAKITSFLTLLENFDRFQRFISSISPKAQECGSLVLKRLLSFTTEGGLFPNYNSTLEYFETAFDHENAKRTGKIIPAFGVDKQYDECQQKIDEVKRELDDYLEEQKKVLRCRHLEYFGTAKNRYQIQVPEAFCKEVPDVYRIETTRKGYKRYYTQTIDRLFQKLTTFEEEMKRCVDGIMSTIFAQFSRKHKLWSSAVECMAILDTLQSIATFVRSLKAQNIDICRPELIEEHVAPLVNYTGGRHPALVKIDSNYISNDLLLDDRTILLSGANMGGKSTLMRQTATLVILAQLGSFVPASSLRMTPVDRIFSRLGASDRMIEGDSTFYIELVETSVMLQSATKHSLLLLDELGRGTSTYDGTAIAYATLKEISENLKCRCLFSTHYHTLVRDFESCKRVRLAHMACKVEKKSKDVTDTDPLKEDITFLYKIAEGPVGRSYGFNVARLAGIGDQIIREAYKKSREIELSCKALEKLQELCSTGKPQVDDSHLKGQILACLAG